MEGLASSSEVQPDSAEIISQPGVGIGFRLGDVCSTELIPKSCAVWKGEVPLPSCYLSLVPLSLAAAFVLLFSPELTAGDTHRCTFSSLSPFPKNTLSLKG